MSTNQTTRRDREAAMQELADLGQIQGNSTPEEAVAAIKAVRAEEAALLREIMQ